MNLSYFVIQNMDYHKENGVSLFKASSKALHLTVGYSAIVNVGINKIVSLKLKMIITAWYGLFTGSEAFSSLSSLSIFWSIIALYS